MKAMKTTGLAACAALGVAAAASGATVNTDTGYLGTAWGNPKAWVDGALPGDQPGAVLDTGAGSNPEIRMDDTNRVVGTIITRYGTMPASGGWFKISNVNAGKRIAPGDNPQTICNTSFGFADGALTFDNGGAGAVIQIDDGTLGADAATGGDGTQRQPFHHFYDMPITLADSLLLDLNFASTDKYGLYTATTWTGPIWNVAFAGKISGAADKKITVDATAPLAAVALLNDANDFAGDVEVKSGTLRAHDTADLPRKGTPLGRGNAIVATSGASRVDLGGFITGEGQTLELAGKSTLGSDANGVLYSSWARKDAFAEWQGAVSLAGDTWIGGQIAGTGWPNNFYPNATPGDLAITGPIADKADPAAIHVVNGQGSDKRTVSFGGANTFSGGLHLDNGYFNATRDAAFGAGGVYFDGGTYRFMHDDDANVFDADLSADGTGGFNVKVDAGVTAYASPGGFEKMVGKRFYKYGEGTLVLTNYCHSADSFAYVYAGTVLLDTTQENYVKFGNGANSWGCDQVYCYNNTRFVVTGDETASRWGAIYFVLQDGAGCTFRAEKNQKFNFMPYDSSAKAGYGVVETDGSSAYFAHNGAQKTRDYVDGYGWLFWEGRSWCHGTANSRLEPVPDAAYKTTWEGVEATNLVDVTAALAASPVPAGQNADCLRFNTPNDGKEIVLTLGGDLTLDGRTILVTPEMGTTPIRITGGAIKASTVLRVVNFNTNATLTIESDVATTGGNLQFAACGPGKTILKGAKSFNHLVFVIGGTLAVDCADALGKAQGEWNSGYVYLSNGGTIEALEDFDPVKNATTRTEFGLKVAETGGGLAAAEGKTLALSANYINVSGLFKAGKGTLALSGNYARVLSLDVREGKVLMQNLASEEAGEVIGRDGVTLTGANWIRPNQAGANGGGSRSEFQGKRTLRVDGDVVVDVDGATVAWSDSTVGYDRLGNTEFFAGTGTLHVVDRSESGAGNISVGKFRDALFRGTVAAEVPVTGSGLKMPHATWHVPAGCTTSFSQECAPRRDTALARLTGTGKFHVDATQSFEPGYFTLGEDGGADADFPGVLEIIQGAGSCSAIQLLKIGDNAQRISGTANRLEGHTIVRAGSLLVGADSPATTGASGALGEAMVYVGDAETPAAAAPALLADGAFAIANEIRVHDTSPAAATPTLGGTAQANGATFAGKVTLWRDAALFAGAGATVSFTGEFVDNGHAVSKTGDGVVSLAGGATVKTIAGGTLSAGGKLTFADGATVDVSSFPAGAFDDKKVSYLFAEADGGLEGVDGVSLVGLPEAKQAKWKLFQIGNRLSLRYERGTALIVR